MEVLTKQERQNPNLKRLPRQWDNPLNRNHWFSQLISKAGPFECRRNIRTGHWLVVEKVAGQRLQNVPESAYLVRLTLTDPLGNPTPFPLSMHENEWHLYMMMQRDIEMTRRAIDDRAAADEYAENAIRSDSKYGHRDNYSKLLLDTKQRMPLIQGADLE
jgi:hypothetical protein